MWNNLLKLTVVSYVWKRHKKTLIALPILLIYFWIVNLIHHDVIAFATLKESTQWLGWSFLIKWIFILLGVLVFIYIHISSTANPADSLSSTPENKVKRSKKSQHSDSDSPEKDPFQNIRQKTKLRTKAEIILEEKDK
jgi:uncharacterized protein involved in cysteine biosynthesis